MKVKFPKCTRQKIEEKKKNDNNSIVMKKKKKLCKRLKKLLHTMYFSEKTDVKGYWTSIFLQIQSHKI